MDEKNRQLRLQGSTEECEGVQGMTGCQYRVPVCRMPKGYRVPGLLKITRAQKLAGQVASDEYTV
jgi:hypothetical protein